ncbi:hypothetical protein Plhal304r1_c008g0031181 [Plasmopara halstedii]
MDATVFFESVATLPKKVNIIDTIRPPKDGRIYRSSKRISLETDFLELHRKLPGQLQSRLTTNIDSAFTSLESNTLVKPITGEAEETEAETEAEKLRLRLRLMLRKPTERLRTNKCYRL